ncbi:hypothetical protein Hanom_Chr06g00549861 [Helianthus anomalus]
MREWSLFDFVDPLRHTALKAADRMLGEQEPNVLKIHLEQFCYQLYWWTRLLIFFSLPPAGGAMLLS